MDLDDFKGVNDALGHAIGDALLRAVAERLRRSVRAGDTVARWGGDEFIVLLPSITRAEDAAGVARAILEGLRAPFILSGYHLYSGASLGVSVFPDTASDADDLIKHADAALYEVKNSDKGEFRFFTDGEQARPALGAGLQVALADAALELRYTPRVSSSAAGTTLTAFSVQAFWPGPRGQLTPTLPLLPLLSDWGLAPVFYEQLLRGVCEQAQVWPPEVRAAVTVPTGLVTGALLELCLRTLAHYGLLPERLELCVYGAAPGKNGMQVFSKLRAAGVHLSLRGFGSLGAPLELLRLPFSGLGIDEGVVAGLTEAGQGNHRESSSVSAVLVETAARLGHSLGAEVYAQGVTNVVQRRALAQVGCTRLEGPLVGAACSGAAAADLLRQPGSWRETT